MKQMVSGNESISAVFTIDAGDLGQSGNQATMMLSQIFYDDKYRDLKKLYEDMMGYITSEIQLRGSSKVSGCSKTSSRRKKRLVRAKKRLRSARKKLLLNN